MPRYARIHVTGGLFHVISQFHDKRYYLDMDGARERYLDLLGKAAATHDGRIVAYCLMSSHIHLVMQLGTDPIGLLTRKVHAPFGAWVKSHRSQTKQEKVNKLRPSLIHPGKACTISFKMTETRRRDGRNDDFQTAGKGLNPSYVQTAEKKPVLFSGSHLIVKKNDRKKGHLYEKNILADCRGRIQCFRLGVH